MPRSWFLFALSLACLLVATFLSMIPSMPVSAPDYFLTLLTSLLGVLFYAIVLLVTGRSRRTLQTLTSIIACGAILTLLFAAVLVLFSALLGPGIGLIAAMLIIFWSVPVEGHIISRAIDQHWYVGIAIAIAAFALQVEFQQAFAT